MGDSGGLTEAEASHVRRFWYEVRHEPDGPDATLEDCRGYYTSHYYDLATLAAVSGIQHDEGLLPPHLRGPADHDVPDPPPAVPFPWPSPDALHDRAAELASVPEAGRAVFSLTTRRGGS